MSNAMNWDWDTREKRFAVGAWRDTFGWVEEPYVSPDGEKVAAIVRLEDESFSVCVNGDVWPVSFEKIWHLRFAPDGRLTALVCDEGEWTVAVDGQPWESRFDYVWSPLFSADGTRLAVAFQQGLKYGMAVEDVSWEARFANMTDMAISPDGRHSAATVQTEGLSEGDIHTFEKGVFTSAVNGEAWSDCFINAWGNAFSDCGAHLAAEVRLDREHYTIAVDGKRWNRTYAAVWEPRFKPGHASVTASVRTPDGWTLARDGELLWTGCFQQCWHHQYSPEGEDIAAIVSPEFGKWTIAVNGVPWRQRAKEFLTDMVFSPDGRRIAAAARSGERWTVWVADSRWRSEFDRLWPPLFSPNGGQVAAKVQRDGRYTIAVNDKCWTHTCDAVWPPVFSPSGDKVLVRSIEEGSYYRRILPLAELS